MVVNNSKEITRGDTGMFSITLYDAEGVEYIPTEGETFPDDNTENMSDSDDDSE